MNEITFKNKENFKAEIQEHMRVYGSTFAEAIVEYQQKYELDESYIANRLVDKDLKELLETEWQIKRMLPR